MGTSGLAGRVGKLEAATRGLPTGAQAELEAFLEQLSDVELRAVRDVARAVQRGQPVAGDPVERALGAERSAKLCALLAAVRTVGRPWRA